MTSAGTAPGVAGDIGVGQRDLERFERIGHHEAMLENLVVGQQHGLVNELVIARGGDQGRQVDAAPAFVHVRDGHGVVRVVHVRGGIDQGGLDQGRGGGGVGVGGPVVLDEHGRRARGVRAGLAGAAHVEVIVRNQPPGVVVVGIDRTQRGDPGARGDHVRFDASVFARAAAGEIRHGVRAFGVDGEFLDGQVAAVAVAGAGGDDILGHRRAADGAGPGAGVAGGEFQDVGLVAGAQDVGVADQGVEFHRAQVVAALGVVPPTVRPDHRPGVGGVARQGFKVRRRGVVARVVEKCAARPGCAPGATPRP